MLKSFLSAVLITICLALLGTAFVFTSTTAASPFVGWGCYGVTDGLDFSDVVAVSAGYVDTLLLNGDGTVTILPNANQPASAPPNVDHVVAIAAGYYHSLALKDDGTVVAWGSNHDGQIDIPAGLNNVIAIAAGNYHSVALKADGSLVVWGDSDDIYHLRQLPAGLQHVVAIAAGESNILALRQDGTVVGWGSNVYGQTTAPSALTNVIAIAAAHSLTVALKADGTVIVFGDVMGSSSMPAGLHDVTAISASYQHIIALRADGTVVAWGGNNLYGELNVPPGLSGVSAIAAGGCQSIVLKQHGSLHIPTVTATATSALTPSPAPPIATATATSALTPSPTPSATPEANRAVIGAQGGELVSADASVRLIIPAGAASGPIHITYSSQPAPAHMLNGDYLVRKSFLIQAEDAAGGAISHTLVPYTLTIAYADQSRVAQAIGAAQLELLAWSTGEWVRVSLCTGCSQDPIADHITFTADRFTEFVLVARTQQSIRLPLIRS